VFPESRTYQGRSWEVLGNIELGQDQTHSLTSFSVSNIAPYLVGGLADFFLFNHRNGMMSPMIDIF
jgi:hypothetical protein